MTKITLYHNPRCSKSRATLELLKQQNIEPEIVLYLETAPDEISLQNITRLLGVKAHDLLRTGEEEYSEEMKSWSEDQIFAAINANPILLQRPILVVENNQLENNQAEASARIGRPPEAVLEII